jgi:hypothetical protein
MSTDTRTLSSRALQQRLDDSGYDWTEEMARPEVDWLRWAIVRDAAKILSVLRLPAFQKLREETRSRGAMPQVEFDPVERHFLKLAMVLATQYLVRLPEYGPLWNGIQARRGELRAEADALDRAGQKAAADRLRAQMPAALRRADVAQRRKRKEEETATPVTPPSSPSAAPNAGPVAYPPQRDSQSTGLRL